MVYTLSKEEIREENKQRVMDATLERIKNVGIQSITVSEIAKIVGISTKSIERYYEDKEKLLWEAVIFLSNKKLTATVDRFEGLKVSNKTGIKLLEEYFIIQKSYFKDNCMDYVMMNEIEMYVCRKGFRATEFNNYAKHLIYLTKLFEFLMKKGVEDGTVKEDRATEEVATMVCIIGVSVIRRLSVVSISKEKWRIPFNAEEQLDLSADMILEYLRK